MTETLTLARLTRTDYATYGQLATAEHEVLAVTLERPWLDNARDVSCVPAGTYTARRRWSDEHHCELFQLEDVPGRGNIELHIGNLPTDSKGCILLGARFGEAADRKGHTGHGVLDSHVAFQRFMARMAGVDSFRLTITDPPAMVAA